MPVQLNFKQTKFFQEKRILLAHSNNGSNMLHWHGSRQTSAIQLGYKLSTFCMTDYYPYTIFPYLDRKWRKHDPKLMKLYDVLGEKIENCDVFIHFNGALIHPEFLKQFNKLKIYHCADDPDASKVISMPVAKYYDICAISNPACIEMYKAWGCKNVFFWPLGAFHHDDQIASNYDNRINDTRDIPLVFIGSKFGATSIRIIGKYLGLYKKKQFFNKIEKEFPELVAYGSGWVKGLISDELVPDIFLRSQIGINIHNSLGPINGRLYDLAAFGVCQICDNKRNLNLVFDEGREIIGFETHKECIDLIRYYLSLIHI